MLGDFRLGCVGARPEGTCLSFKLNETRYCEFVSKRIVADRRQRGQLLLQTGPDRNVTIA